jgi:hypothetical protein
MTIYVARGFQADFIERMNFGFVGPLRDFLSAENDAQ